MPVIIAGLLCGYFAIPHFKTELIVYMKFYNHKDNGDLIPQKMKLMLIKITLN